MSLGFNPITGLYDSRLQLIATDIGQPVSHHDSSSVKGGFRPCGQGPVAGSRAGREGEVCKAGDCVKTPVWVGQIPRPYGGQGPASSRLAGLAM